MARKLGRFVRHEWTGWFVLGLFCCWPLAGGFVFTVLIGAHAYLAVTA
jgi:hypothetical protein